MMSDRVMVFAPTPLLTVTIEQQAGAAELHVHPGGQGVWEARMIASLGSPVTLCVGVGGEVGAVLEKLLIEEDVTLRAIVTQSGSGWYVHDRRNGKRVQISDDPGHPLARHDIDELYNMALAEGLPAALAVLSGPASPAVVDPDIYRRLAADLMANGTPVVADLSGAHLSAALAGGVAFVKVSHEELVADGRADDDSVGALVSAAYGLRQEGAASVLVSRAGQPGIALLDDQLFEVQVPPLQVADHRGAGDSTTAGVAAVLAHGGDPQEAVRTGAAAGALNVTRHGLGTGRAEAVRELISRVRLTPLSQQ